jgi:hypothetical protein
MAVLIGSVPSGFTFRDLVGGPMINTPPRHSASGKQDDGNTSGCLTRESRMRIYLPDGAVREMTLTEYQEFLVSYRVSDLSQAVADTADCREDVEQTRGAMVTGCSLDRGSLDHTEQHLCAMYSEPSRANRSQSLGDQPSLVQANPDPTQ